MPALELLACEYAHALTVFAEAWARSHPVAYREITEKTTALYRPVPGGFAATMHAVHRACAERGRFPSFEIFAAEPSRAPVAPLTGNAAATRTRDDGALEPVPVRVDQDRRTESR